MSNNTYLKNQNKFNQDLFKKCWSDSNFKTQLLKDPKTTIENFTTGQVVIKSNINVVVEDQSNGEVIYFNIPKNIDLDDFELDSEELESVAGGATITVTSSQPCAAGAAVALGILGNAIYDFANGAYTAIKDHT